ncbi:hypothetical protein CHS0354_013830, partial [Potamilus streckersoni]
QTHVCLPNGHNLITMIDRAFERMDLDKNGDITLAEYETYTERGDTNKDGRVSLDEYLVGAGSQEIEGALFHHYDHDQDNLLEITDVVLEFHEMDHSRDGMITRKELEIYYSNLLHHIFGNRHCGGHNTIVG